MTRSPGRYGRRPPKRHPAIPFGALLTGTVPVHPPSADYLAALGGGWKMLGNGPDPENSPNGVPADGAGDCVAVTYANLRRLVTTTITATPAYPPLSQVIAWYKTQNPGFPSQDDGMEIQTFLEYLVKAGDILAFAKVDFTSPAEVQAAIAIVGGVWVGIDVLTVNEGEFAAHQPWDFVPGVPDAGGHSVLVGGYGPPGVGQLGGDERFITWAQETSFTDRFWSRLVQECWAVIFPEHLGSKEFLTGMDVAALAAAYTAITGRPFPSTVPPLPVPVPVPPLVTAADLAFAHDPKMIKWSRGPHHGLNGYAAQAFRDWAAGVG